MSAPPVSARPDPQALLRRLLSAGAVPADAWDALPAADRATVAAAPDLPTLADALLGRRLLTPFQAGRVRTGEAAGLVLGGYRLLRPAGGGFQAEHVRLRRPATVTPLPPADRRRLDRFFLEQRAVAALRHPALVGATDAGEEPHAGPAGRPLPFVVTDPVPGRTLAEWVAADGPLPPTVACRLGRTLADALTEAHRHGLVHRGVCPRTVRVGPDGHPRLDGFGTARLLADPPPGDAPADVGGLGETLRFALTAGGPWPADLPPGLADLVTRLLDPDPTARPAAAAVARDLHPFCEYHPPGVLTPPPAARPGHRVLVVDDEAPVRALCRLALRTEPVTVGEAADGAAAVAAAGGYDLLLLDVDLPGLDGERVLRALRAAPPAPHLKVVMLSGRTGADLSRLLAAGADDYLPKPFSVVELRNRVAAALRLKDAQDRADRLARQMAAGTAQLEVAVSAKADELLHARGAMVLALVKLVERRSSEGGGHLLRLQRYCRVLAEAAAATPGFAGRLSPDVVAAVDAAAPLHDIGKVAVPDAVLLKPGPLTPDERRQMQAHTTAGAATLAEVAAHYPLFGGFFATAVEVARSHHERWDGTGYPDGLAGDGIPLAARLVAVADVYDALRSRRVYKPGLTHAEAAEQMLARSPGHFDPALLAVFERVADPFDRVFCETDD